ncbi:MAG UNVERIFIED_CONTAM: hypothetical protein LVR18_37360 [Planctomycetaceae bacterium]
MPISNGRQAVAERHRRELAEFLASFPRPSPRLRGLSPRPESLSSDYYESSGSIGSERTSSRRPRSPSPKLRGLSPRPRALSSDCCESSGSIGSNERSIVTHAATPRSCGDCPRDRER